MMMSTMSGEISDSCKDRLITCLPSTADVGVGDEDRPELDESDSELNTRGASVSRLSTAVK